MGSWLLGREAQCQQTGRAQRPDPPPHRLGWPGSPLRAPAPTRTGGALWGPREKTRVIWGGQPGGRGPEGQWVLSPVSGPGTGDSGGASISRDSRGGRGVLCLQGKEPSVRQLALLHFRNTITLSVKLEDALARSHARVPPAIVQMLLVLQVGGAPWPVRRVLGPRHPGEGADGRGGLKGRGAALGGSWWSSKRDAQPAPGISRDFRSDLAGLKLGALRDVASLGLCEDNEEKWGVKLRCPGAGSNGAGVQSHEGEGRP
ncbi:hypothetical protein HPG69_006286 [Diceros bicornis minor]|uniref:Uncharacterized protein n=1 Tax=Diceros bicornis minor TaxID=77932 RepID=A0A7J7FPY8_DICBM|nr:hypothetical protein HPG69_006286 [Diceros bicornis minor]